ncbi:sporulation YhaL family protein [Falsibacillus pallidus]|uniref:sporulation YhaL family protein n=1 Tax=Falsibacillus pallidus TaxID=493781 RepID=UPI003D968A8C
MTLPIWIYFIAAGILFSAFMTVKSAKDERETENEWIEKEGEIYITRMEKEKETRKNKQMKEGA